MRFRCRWRGKVMAIVMVMFTLHTCRYCRLSACSINLERKPTSQDFVTTVGKILNSIILKETPYLQETTKWESLPDSTPDKYFLNQVKIFKQLLIVWKLMHQFKKKILVTSSWNLQRYNWIINVWNTLFISLNTCWLTVGARSISQLSITNKKYRCYLPPCWSKLTRPPSRLDDRWSDRYVVVTNGVKRKKHFLKNAWLNTRS